SRTCADAQTCLHARLCPPCRSSVSQTIVYGVRAGGIAMAKIVHDRREFVGRAFCLTVGGGLAASGLGAQAQTPPRAIRRSERYDDSFITERKPFKWPGNSTIAV